MGECARSRPAPPSAAACGWIEEHRPDAACTATLLGRDGGPGQPPGPGRVEVTVTLTYRPLILGAAGAGTQVVSASAQARPATGADTEVTTP